MFRSISALPITATVSIAAAVAGLAIFLTTVAPETKASPLVMRDVHQPLAKGDRLPVRAWGKECSSVGWPNYEQSCQFDLRRPADAAPTVRIIALR